MFRNAPFNIQNAPFVRFFRVFDSCTYVPDAHIPGYAALNPGNA